MAFNIRCNSVLRLLNETHDAVRNLFSDDGDACVRTDRDIRSRARVRFLFPRIDDHFCFSRDKSRKGHVKKDRPQEN